MGGQYKDTEKRRQSQKTYHERHKEARCRKQREYQRAHSDQTRETARRRRLERQDELRMLKARPCVDCGIQYPACVMDFDHVRGIKKYGIKAESMRRQDLAQELAKCELRCANCHRLRHDQ